MKIVELREGVYTPLREVASLAPFAEASLAGQLLELREYVGLTDPPQFLVFSREEEDLVNNLIGQLARNIGRDCGLGRIYRLESQLLETLAEAVRWKPQHIPFNGETQVTVADMATWSLAFKPID